MTPRLFSTVAVAAALTAAACGPATQNTPAEVATVVVPGQQPDPVQKQVEATETAPKRVDKRFKGVWMDLETRARHTVEERDGNLVVTSVIDDDGEVYEVRNSNWDGTTLKWTYYVPSTHMLVTIKSKKVQGDVLSSTWSNNDGSGDQDFERVNDDE